jgi:hypothetical protein
MKGSFAGGGLYAPWGGAVEHSGLIQTDAPQVWQAGPYAHTARQERAVSALPAGRKRHSDAGTGYSHPRIALRKLL